MSLDIGPPVGSNIDRIDPFRYFEKGREGVRSRFAQIIGNKLGELTYNQASILLDRVKLPLDVIKKFKDGDTTQINHRVVEDLTDPLQLDISNIFGQCVNLSEKEVKELASLADQDRFMLVGYTRTSIGFRLRVESYLLLGAFAKL